MWSEIWLHFADTGQESRMLRVSCENASGPTLLPAVVNRIPVSQLSTSAQGRKLTAQ